MSIQINLTARNPEVIKKLQEVGFEFVSPTETELIGKIGVEKLAQLAEVEEVKLNLPEVK